MNAPTWDELRAKEEAAKRLAEMDCHGQIVMLKGSTPGRTCGECRFLVDKADYSEMTPGRYFKCLMFRAMNEGRWGGPKTDWRKKWPACGGFEAVTVFGAAPTRL